MINSAQIIGFLLVSGNFRTGDCENAFPGETGKEKVNHSQGDTASKNSVSDFGEDQEYFPYGETWVHNKATNGQESTPYKFTSKELDEETGLYYYGWRYFDPKLSRWESADPPLSRGTYFPVPPVNDKAKERNSNLPGMGGVFNSINLDAYHYAGQNPVKLIDPDGNVTLQVGLSATASTFFGISGEGGLVAGFSMKNGFEFGSYTVKPKSMIGKASGVHSDVGISGAVNFSVSLAESINQLDGDCITTGMSVDAGAAAFVTGVIIQGGGAVNIPLDLKSPKSFSGSIGLSGSVSPVDTYAQTNTTKVTNFTSKPNSNGGGYFTNIVNNAMSKIILETKKK